jgi:methyltransferase (TIGR00027 family)
MDAGRASRTAAYMALFRAVETARRSARLFDDPLATTLLPSDLRTVAAVARLPVVGPMVPWVLDRGWPRTRSSGVVRTAAIDALVLDALAAGARQLVLLGAGFDSRPYRLPLADALTFEVDHPATQAVKAQRLRASGVEVDRTRFVGVDFERDDVARALRTAGFDAGLVSVVVWEGVVSYLSSSAVDGTFSLLARILAPSSRLIFTYVDKGALDGSRHFDEARRWKWWVGRNGEPFVFGFDPAEIGAYLAAHGFRLVSDVSTAEVARTICEPLGRDEPGSALYRLTVAERE